MGYNKKGLSLLRCYISKVPVVCCSPRVIGATLHLSESRLVQGTGVDVHDVAVSRCPVSQRLVMLECMEGQFSHSA